MDDFSRTPDDYEIIDAEFAVLRDQALADGLPEPEPMKIWSTKVEIELQFYRDGEISSIVLKDYTETIVTDGWIANKLWIPTDCFTSTSKPCFTQGKYILTLYVSASLMSIAGIKPLNFLKDDATIYFYFRFKRWSVVPRMT